MSAPELTLTIAGFVARNAEIRYTQAGTPRPWPTDDLIIIHDGCDRGVDEPIEPGTIALRDAEGDYYTRDYGWLCRFIDEINDWTPIDPHKETP